MEEELRERLFAVAVAAGLISHETPLRNVEVVLRGLVERREAFMRAPARAADSAADRPSQARPT